MSYSRLSHRISQGKYLRDILAVIFGLTFQNQCAEFNATYLYTHKKPVIDQPYFVLAVQNKVFKNT